MGRHLVIGNGTAVAYTAGVLAAGAIDVQKKSANGAHTSVLAADTNLTAPEIRFAQGSANGNIYSPWIKVANAINWDGKSYAAAVAANTVATYSGTLTNAGELTVKVMNVSNGVEPFEIKSWTLAYAAGATLNATITAIHTEINADLPAFIASTSVATPAITFNGYNIGALDGNGERVINPGNFKVMMEDTAGQITDSLAVTPPVIGVGEPYRVLEFEKSLQGSTFGYYNRVQQPIAPATSVDVANDTYDMYNLVVTKDGSTTSGINGVDNLIEISIALDSTTAATTTAFEAQLDGLLVGFTPVAL